MNQRANALADRIEQGAAQLASYAEKLSDKEWRTSVGGKDGRPVGVIVHHVASVYPIEVDLAKTIASGKAVAGVTWEVVAGPDVWIGTKVTFDLRQDDDYAIVLFKHAGWKEPIEFMHHCSTKWATFLMSLKSMLETGKGAAFPNDVHIGRFD